MAPIFFQVPVAVVNLTRGDSVRAALLAGATFSTLAALVSSPEGTLGRSLSPCFRRLSPYLDSPRVVGPFVGPTPTARLASRYAIVTGVRVELERGVSGGEGQWGHAAREVPHDHREGHSSGTLPGDSAAFRSPVGGCHLPNCRTVRIGI